MKKVERIRVLLLAPYSNGEDVGESFHSFNWARELAKQTKLTVLTLHREGQTPLQTQLPDASIITLSSFSHSQRFERLNAMLKPSYLKFYYLARKWIKTNTSSFDIIHQMTPAAIRYPSPGAGLGLPLVHGPLQGSLETPKGLAKHPGISPWYMKLRNLDKIRLKFDPWLRKSFKQTDLVLSGADYSKRLISITNPPRIENLIHLNIEELAHHPQKLPPTQKNTVHLLYVGRLIRTKGLEEAIQAVHRSSILSKLRFDVIGEGPERNKCQSLCKRLNLANQVFFHGKIERKEVEEFYSKADVFLFPSFREPAGGVVLEAMRHGLPVLTTNTGGPGYYITKECGYAVDTDSSEQMIKDLAQAIDDIATNADLYQRMQQATYDRAQRLGNFQLKIDWLLEQYQLLSNSRGTF